MHYKPKKRLGQNFLVDKNIQKKLVRACNFAPHDTVLEIGAGTGELTGLIAGQVSKIYALEIDKDLCANLKKLFDDYPNVRIVSQDVLQFNFKKYFCGKKVKILGNIPYYISTPIIERLINFREVTDTVFITVQKEFAERVCAASGSKTYGSLSCFVQYYFKPQIIMQIKKNSFFPAPKVDSCFLRLEAKKNLPLKKSGEKLFFRIVRQAFNQRRKTLRNSLKNIIPPEKLQRFLASFNLDSNIRPEQLTIQDFINLVKTLLYRDGSDKT